jgi:hypothetical protein
MKHVGINCFLILAILSLTLNAKSQNVAIKTNTQLSQVSKTYGFLLGQEYSLRRITTDFPDLSQQVSLATSEFNLSFGRARKEIPISLRSAIAPNYDNYERKLMTQLDSIARAQKIDRNVAINFINEVNDRAKGNIPSPMLEMLLTYEFQQAPEQEIIRDYTYPFKTLNHTKAKGTDWLLKLPKSWNKREASRPNIIQEFRSCNGNGMESLAIMVKDLQVSKNYAWSSKELATVFSEKTFREMVPLEAKYISSKRIIIDNNQAGMLETEQVVPRLDLEFKVRSIQFFVYKGNKMYMLMCSVSSADQNEELQSRMTKFLPLFKLVANSIVFNEQYKK